MKSDAMDDDSSNGHAEERRNVAKRTIDLYFGGMPIMPTHQRAIGWGRGWGLAFSSVRLWWLFTVDAGKFTGRELL